MTMKQNGKQVTKQSDCAVSQTGTGYYNFYKDSLTIDDQLYIHDLAQRKMYINFDIEQDAIGDMIRHILQINKEDYGIPEEERKPILLYISSNGGDEDAGYGLIDAILTSKTPVYTINTGYEYSMAFLIGLAGRKRFSMPNAKFLLHDGEVMIQDSIKKMGDWAHFHAMLEQKEKDYVLSRSRITSEEYDNKTRTEWYMFADEAKEKGFTDYIIGVDCDIDEII